MINNTNTEPIIYYQASPDGSTGPTPPSSLPTPQSGPSPDVLTSIVGRVLKIEDVTWGDPKVKELIARYRGHLYGDSEAAYDQLAETLRPLDITPLFRPDGEGPQARHAVLLMRGIIRPQPSDIRWNIVMFILTVLSVIYVGAMNSPEATNGFYGITHFWLGLPYTLSLMSILLAHEFGHYIAGRIHKTAVTLPYYIPMPIPGSFGTMGAFIQLKEMPRNRKHLLDIGIAGPLAGLVVAIPILIYGLIISPVETVQAPPPGYGVQFEGNSILYMALKYVVKGEALPSQPPEYSSWSPIIYRLVFVFTGKPVPIGGRDVMLSSIAWAGWVGLLVTALNLIPAGQLDGGHALYVLRGRKAAQLLPFILGALILLGFAWVGWWLWAGIIFLFGRFYAEPLDQITPLDNRRKALAILVLVIFVLIFMPVPLTGVFGQ